MLSQTQIESQLAARRLDIEELKRQLASLSNLLTGVNKSIKDLTETVNNLPITAGIGGNAANDSYLVGDTWYHRLKHVFTDKLGFFNAIPAAKQTLNAYTTASESVAFTGIASTAPGSVFAQVADLNSLRLAYEIIRASYDDLRTKLQNTTLVG